jgi:hypothetical protein
LPPRIEGCTTTGSPARAFVVTSVSTGLPVLRSIEDAQLTFT